MALKLISRVASIFGLSTLIAIQCAAQSAPLVEDIEIRGYRTVSREEILKEIETRPGKPFNRRRARLDFERLMKTGVFDSLKSKFVIEDGPRSGKVVIFILHETPKEK